MDIVAHLLESDTFTFIGTFLGFVLLLFLVLFITVRAIYSTPLSKRSPVGSGIPLELKYKKKDRVNRFGEIISTITIIPILSDSMLAVCDQSITVVLTNCKEIELPDQIMYFRETVGTVGKFNVIHEETIDVFLHEYFREYFIGKCKARFVCIS